MALAQCVALTLALAVPLCLRLVEDGAAQAGYQTLLAAESGLVIIEEPRVATVESFATFQQSTTQLVVSQVGSGLKTVTTYTRAGAFQINALNGKASPGGTNLTAAYYPDLLAHATVVNGAWPDGKGQQNPMPAALSQSGATAAGLNVGDVACVGTQNTPKDRSSCVRLIGTWKPVNTADPYWQSGPSNADLTLSAADYFQFLAAANGAANDVSFRAGRVYQADPSRLMVGDAPALVNGLKQMRGQVVIKSGGSFTTTLDSTIQGFLDRTRVNQFPARLVGVSLVAVVVFALALLSKNYLSAHLERSLLWRIRGGRRDRLAASLVLQMGTLLLPALLLAVVISIATAWLLLSKETGTTVSISLGFGNVAIGLVSGLALVVLVEAGMIFGFSRRTVLEMRRAISGASSAPWWRWRNIDLGLAILAIPLLAEVQLRSQVAVRIASSNADLVGLALPVAAMACLGIAALRVLPLLARVSDMAPRNLAAQLSSMRMRRQPTEHAGLALLLAMAVALGIFASVYSATERQNIVDRAAYKVGADLLVRYDDHAFPDAISNDLAKLERVVSATTVWRKPLQVAGGSLSVIALGVEGRSFLATAWTRNSLSTPSLSSALATLSERRTNGVPVLMSPVTMSKLGIKTGVDIYFSGSTTFLATVVGALDFVPTTYPGADDFMVVSLDRLRAVSADVRPNELWLNVSGDHHPIVSALLRDPNVSFVQDRSLDEANALGDPLFVALQANLAIGFGAALALAVLAFAIHFLITTRKRLSEYAILEASGLEPGVVRTALAIEQGIVVLFALAVGCALALTLVVWLMPSLQLGSSISDLIPPTVLTADWVVLGIGALATVAVAGLLAWSIRRIATSVDTMEELRRLG